MPHRWRHWAPLLASLGPIIGVIGSYCWRHRAPLLASLGPIVGITGPYCWRHWKELCSFVGVNPLTSAARLITSTEWHVQAEGRIYTSLPSSGWGVRSGPPPRCVRVPLGSDPGRRRGYSFIAAPSRSLPGAEERGEPYVNTASPCFTEAAASIESSLL